MAAATVLAPAAAGRSGEIVCGCFDLTRAELESAAASFTFEQFLEETKAGSRCSACLLDVEYLFVNAPKKAGAARETAKRVARPSLKQRLYAFLDHISPLVPFRLVNTAPLISGAGIVQRLWLVNLPLVFGADVDVPPHRFDVMVRDGEGRELARQRHDIPCGETRVIPLPDLPRADGQALAVGSVEVARHGLRPGVRGTTRPHFELEAAHSNTVLHVQGAGPDPEAWLTTVHGPDDTRILFTAVNVAARPLSLDFDVEGAASIHVDVPPFGARVVEPPARTQPGRSVTYHYRGRGRGKVHVLAASPGLDRIAIDHL